MRDVAIVSFAQSASARETRNEVEILMPVVQEAVRGSKLPRAETRGEIADIACFEPEA